MQRTELLADQIFAENPKDLSKEALQLASKPNHARGYENRIYIQ